MRQSNGEFCELADPAIDTDRPAVLLRNDVVADRKAKPRAFASRFGREERLEELVPDLGWNADAVVEDADFDCIAEIPRRHLQGRLEVRVASLLLAFRGRVEAVAEQVEADRVISCGTSSI